MTPAQTFRCLRYKARLPGWRSWGTGEQDRAEERVKEDDKFRLSPTVESHRGELQADLMCGTSRSKLCLSIWVKGGGESL